MKTWLLRPAVLGSDPMFLGLSAFPNVEVRLFNPFCCARESIARKYTASILDFRRLNHRMRNKLFIADGVFAVMGGRNIGDEYFTRSASNNFINMDIFVVGPVVQQLSSIFDAYWNSHLAYPVETIVDASSGRDAARRDFEHLVDDGEQMRSIALPSSDIHEGYARYRPSLLRTGVNIYELSPIRTQQSERLMLPSASLGRLHAKTAVIENQRVR